MLEPGTGEEEWARTGAERCMRNKKQEIQCKEELSEQSRGSRQANHHRLVELP